MTTVVHSQETPDQACLRLLTKARQEGVKLFLDPADGRHYASSTSQPGKQYYVTAYSCTCRGFTQHQRCKHHSALLAALGWLGTDPEPTPGTRIRISHVGGHYAEAGWLVGNGVPEWQEPVSSIYEDGSEMIRITGERFNVRVVWIENGKIVDDMTSTTPYGSHYDNVRYWIKALEGDTPEHVILQAAGLYDDAEMSGDEIPAAA